MQTSLRPPSRVFQFVRFIAVLAILLTPHHLKAAVVAIGDVTPNTDPDLPIFGGTASQEVIVGVTDIGRLVIDVPSATAPLVSPGAIVGQGPAAIGEVVITGLGSEWEVQGTSIIGDEGLAFLSLVGGAQFTSTDEVDSGGNPMPGTGVLYVGYRTGSTGIVTIDGFASRMQSQFTLVGREGDGSIDITNRGNLITQGDASIGVTDPLFALENPFQTVSRPTGRVTLSGLGSRWTVLDNLTIGDDGTDANEQGLGILQIRDQALVQVGNYSDLSPFLDDELIVNANGRIELDGGTVRTLTGSSVTNQDPIQNFGVIKGDGFIDGMLTINPTGELRNAAGVANLRQSMLVSGEVENNGTIESLGGEMEFLSPVVNNFEVVARDAVMRFPEGLENNGLLVVGGNSTLHGPIDFAGGGDLLVLSGSESLVVGDLTFSASTLLNLGVGDAPGTLDIAGAVELGGSTLSLDYSAGVFPQPNDTYQILQASEGITGTFANTTASAGGGIWDIVVEPERVLAVFTGMAALPVGADFNGDGIVNQLDMQIWQANYGRTEPPDLAALGDADGDGDVDGRDFLEIQRKFGGPPLVAASTAVPEPTSLVLLLGAVVGLGWRRR